MPWCPQCETEYRDGIEICADCGAPLCDALPESAGSAPFEGDLGPPALLVIAETDIQGDMMAAVLDSAGIPVLRKHEGIGGYLKVIMGSTPMGVQLHVPETMLDKAREALRATGMLPPEDDFD